MSVLPPVPGPLSRSASSLAPVYGHLRSLFRWLGFDVQHLLQAYKARWERAWRNAEQDYARDVTTALALRDAVRYKAYACTAGGRLPGAVCCDYLLLRREGQDIGQVMHELRRRARRHEAIVGQRAEPYSLGEEGLVRLFGARWRRHVQRRAPDEAMPGLARSGGLLVPPGFHRACQARLAEGGSAPLASSAGLARLLRGRHEAAGMMILLVERAAPAASHALVVDFCASAPGVFDPHYGFLPVEAPSETHLAALLAQLVFRYEGRAVLALEERRHACA